MKVIKVEKTDADAITDNLKKIKACNKMAHQAAKLLYTLGDQDIADMVSLKDFSERSSQLNLQLEFLQSYGQKIMLWARELNKEIDKGKIRKAHR